MAAPATAPPPVSPRGTGNGDEDQEDSNASSPLSEVADTDTKDGDLERMHLDGDDLDNSSLPAESNPDNHEDEDSDSALSDANSDINSEANDTEAETERLYDTPQSQRQRNVVVDQYNQGKVFESTPSKLRRTATVTEKLDHGDDASESGDNSSQASVASPAKAVTTQETSVDDESKSNSQERKRKRSPMNETSELDQPLRKRTGSVGVGDEDPKQQSPANLDSSVPSGEEDGVSSPRKRDTGEVEEPRERRTRSAKNITRNASKRKGGGSDDAEDDTVSVSKDQTGEEEIDQNEVEPDAEGDDEADAAAKNAEELERKQHAFKDWTQIEDMFGVFRDRLYTDRLRRLEEEEQSLTADIPTHPEFLNMRKCLDDRLERKLREIDTELEYRLKAHERRAVAQRAQIWSQFYQAVREKREAALEKLNQEWYDVQTARRSAHSLPDYGLLFPKDESQRVRNAIAYNTEVSMLAGLAKHEGFPAGPEIKGASAVEAEDDFAAMHANRRVRQRSLLQTREEYQAPAFNRLGPAGEQFLKDTPWANPNHSVHRLVYQQQAVQKPDGSVANATGSASGRNAQTVPSAAPAAKTIGETVAAPSVKAIALQGRQSDSTDLSRSMLNPGNQQLNKAGATPGLGRGVKTATA